MATNKMTYRGNVNGWTGPRVVPGLFQAGSSQAICVGEILELTNTSNTKFVPIDSDFLAANQLAVALEEIKSGDRAGYYPVIVPREGDLFEYELAAASQVAPGALLYYSASQKFATSGTYPIARVMSVDQVPQQGHAADDASPDAGTTLAYRTFVQVEFLPHARWLGEHALQPKLLNLGDAGGFAGLWYDAANTTLDAYIDATKVAHVAADGSYNDDVA